MTNLLGRSIVLLKVFSDRLEHAHRDISRMSNVADVWSILGHYDLLVSAVFPNRESLMNLVEQMESKPYCQECKVHPGFMDWERKGAKDSLYKGWTFIDTEDFDSTIEELKRIDNVNYVISTSGDYNMVACIGVDGFQEFGSLLRNNVLTIPGVRKTETFTHAPE